MQFATYCRKSIYSDKSDSVENQIQMCREYADLKFNEDVTSFEVYQDEGFTGANTNRPELQRLLSDVKDGLIDALIVYQLDRLSRDVRDFSNIYAELDEHHVKFISIKENIDTTTPIGRAMTYITMVFAQLERESIATRVNDHMINMSKRGLWTGGNPPTGYLRERTVINGKNHTIIIPDPETVGFIESIYDEFLLNNYSLQSMETAYKREGKKTLSGKFFSTTQLYKILTMPYCVPATPEVWDYYNSLGCRMTNDRDDWDGKCGVMIYGRSTEKNKKHQIQPKTEWIVSEGIHDPFIPAEKWLAVQDRLSQNKFERKKKYDVPLLKGSLRCAKCGCLMQVSRKKLKNSVLTSYYCLTRMRKGVEFCDVGHIKADKLDDLVLSTFEKIKINPDVINEYAEIKEDPDNTEEALRGLERKADGIRNRIMRLTETLAEGSNASKYIIAQIEKEDLALEALQREINILRTEKRKAKVSKASVSDRAKKIEKLMSNLSELSADDKNAIAKEVLQECTWDGETLHIKM